MISHTNATALPLYSPLSSNLSLFLNLTQSAEGMMTTEGLTPTFPKGLGTKAFLDKLLTRAGHPQNNSQTKNPPLGTILQARTTQIREQAITVAQTTPQQPLSTESSRKCSTKDLIKVCDLVTQPSSQAPLYSVKVINSSDKRKNITFSEGCGGDNYNIPPEIPSKVDGLSKSDCWKDGEWEASDPRVDSMPLTSKERVKLKPFKSEKSFLLVLWEALNPWVKIGNTLAGVLKGRPSE